MASDHERYGSEDHGIGDAARRLGDADAHDQFGTGGRTQNLPEDYGTGRDPQPYDHRYREDPYAQSRYADRPHLFDGGSGDGMRVLPPGRWGEPGGGRGYSGRYESLQHLPPPRGEWPGREQARGFRGLGPRDYMRSDERIREDICERLWDADDVDARDVTVEVQGGEVTLRGTVDQRRTRHRIEDIADDCGGVKDIRNELRVRRRGWGARDEAAGSTEEASRRSAQTGRKEGLLQSAIEQMPPRG